MMFMRKKEKGFTLIEVMLVVIIIGIIAIIALPKLLVTKSTAEEKACQSNAQAIRTQLEQYKWNEEAGYPATLDALIGNATYFPPDSSTSKYCPKGTGGTGGLGEYVYTASTPVDGIIESFTFVCPNDHF